MIPIEAKPVSQHQPMSGIFKNLKEFSVHTFDSEVDYVAGRLSLAVVRPTRVPAGVAFAHPLEFSVENLKFHNLKFHKMISLNQNVFSVQPASLVTDVSAEHSFLTKFLI